MDEPVMENETAPKVYLDGEEGIFESEVVICPTINETKCVSR